MKFFVVVLGLMLSGSWIALRGESFPLVNHQDSWRYRKGTSAPQADWKTADDSSLDASWLGPAPGGFGYGDGDDVTVLGDMDDSTNGYTTLYIRKTFFIDAPPDPDSHLLLTLDYDDGFVAWLDGVELERDEAPGSIGEEPDFFDEALNNHEASAGNNGNPPSVFDLGPVGDRLDSGSHVLAVMGLNVSGTSSDFSLIADLAYGDPPPGPTTLTTDATWTADSSPYVIGNQLTIAPAATLVIQPGVTVLFGQNARLVVEGRLLGEGTEEQPILLTREAGASNWDGIEFRSSPGESRLTFAQIEFATGNISATGTRLFLDHVTWSDTNDQMLNLVDTAAIVLNSHFPGISSGEPFHFSEMPEDGYLLVQGNVFGPPLGYNDVLDVTGGNRPGPISEFIDNVFLAAVDECFDLDGTDAHIEGNLFLNVKQDAARASSSNAISTGEANGETAELVIVRNFFYNCDHALLLKESATAIFDNNTVVDISPNPLDPQPSAMINFGEPNRGVDGGLGLLMDGNIAWDLQGAAFANFESDSMFLSVNHSIIQNLQAEGEGNSTADPMFVDWESPLTAENIRENLALLPRSPAIGAGPNGLDMGANVPAGATITGEPEGVTRETSATLKIAGPGIFAYKWKLDDGPWSEEIALTNSIAIHPDMFADARPITLENLSDGAHTVYVIGKNSAGRWQSMDQPTVSKTWTVAASILPEMTLIDDPENTISFQFPTQPNTSYSVLYRDSLTNGAWQKLESIDVGPDAIQWEITDTPPDRSSRFYEIVSPAWP